MAAGLRIPFNIHSIRKEAGNSALFGFQRCGLTLCSMFWPVSITSTLAKILSQIKNGNPPIPVEIFAQAKAKDPATDAVPRFLEAYISHSRIATLTKEAHTGKLVDEWNKLLDSSEQKPELVDMAPAVSSFMAVKDEEELVSMPGIKRDTPLTQCHRKPFGPQPTLPPLSWPTTSQSNSRQSSIERQKSLMKHSRGRSRRGWDTAREMMRRALI